MATDILSRTVSELSQLIVQISHQRGHFHSKCQVEGVVRHQSFLHRLLGQWMPYNFVPDSFHTADTAEALRAKIDRKSAISHQRGHFDPKFQVQGVAPTNNFCTVS